MKKQKEMSDATWMIRKGMADIKIQSVTVLAKRMGLTRPTMNRKVLAPSSFSLYEIQALAKLFNWSDEQIGEFIRGLQ